MDSANPQLNPGQMPTTPVVRPPVYVEQQLSGEVSRFSDGLSAARKEKIRDVLSKLSAETEAQRDEMITADLVDRMYMLFLDEKLKDASEEFEFQGFQPDYLFRRVLAIAGGNVSNLMRDMYLVIMFYIQRGTKVQKAARKMSPAGSAMILALSDKYTIVDSVPKSKETVTVSRLMSVFPSCVATAMKKSKKEPIVVVEGLPKALSFPASPSIIPAGEQWLIYRFLHYVYTFRFNQLINKKKKIVVDYDEISFKSTYIPDATRVQIMEDLGIKPFKEMQSGDVIKVSDFNSPNGFGDFNKFPGFEDLYSEMTELFNMSGLPAPNLAFKMGDRQTAFRYFNQDRDYIPLASGSRQPSGKRARSPEREPAEQRKSKSRKPAPVVESESDEKSEESSSSESDDDQGGPRASTPVILQAAQKPTKAPSTTRTTRKQSQKISKQRHFQRAPSGVLKPPQSIVYGTHPSIKGIRIASLAVYQKMGKPEIDRLMDAGWLPLEFNSSLAAIELPLSVPQTPNKIKERSLLSGFLNYNTSTAMWEAAGASSALTSKDLATLGQLAEGRVDSKTMMTPGVLLMLLSFTGLNVLANLLTNPKTVFSSSTERSALEFLGDRTRNKTFLSFFHTQEERVVLTRDDGTLVVEDPNFMV